MRRAVLATVLFALSASLAFAEPESPQAVFTFTAPESTVVRAERKGREALLYCSNPANLTQWTSLGTSREEAFSACVLKASHGEAAVISYGKFYCVTVHIIVVESGESHMDQTRPLRTPTRAREPMVVDSGIRQCVSTGNAP